ncbi:uncharacterized protein LOC144783154 [Lissotriton helveticus]
MVDVGLTLRKEKCVVLTAQAEYLGYCISASGIKPKKCLVSAIELAPAPKNKKQLRSFMGLVEYYSKFVKNVSDKTGSLRSVLKKCVSFEWGEVHPECFNTIKKEIREAKVLALVM